MPSNARRRALHLVGGVAGAALLSWPAAYYRIDRVSCATWPPPLANAALAAAFVAAVALLSLDPLFYAAVGRAMAKQHASPYAQLHTVLPPGDPLLGRPTLAWRAGTSPCFPAWNQLARGIAATGGDALLVQLRLYQALGLPAMLASAALVGIAVRRDEPQRAGSAAAAVLFRPVAAIEATQAGATIICGPLDRPARAGHLARAPRRRAAGVVRRPRAPDGGAPGRRRARARPRRLAARPGAGDRGGPRRRQPMLELSVIDGNPYPMTPRRAGGAVSAPSSHASRQEMSHGGRTIFPTTH